MSGNDASTRSAPAGERPSAPAGNGRPRVVAFARLALWCVLPLAGFMLYAGFRFGTDIQIGLGMIGVALAVGFLGVIATLEKIGAGR